jgi:hypothetical protein
VESFGGAWLNAEGDGIQPFNQTLCADMQGFSLHAAVRCEADDRQAPDQQGV